MNVFCPNEINIYDLSGGKKLPDFLSERKRRDLLRKGEILFPTKQAEEQNIQMFH